MTKGMFFIAGSTATGKSDIAAEVSHELDAEIVGADAFQIYRGFELLTAKPDPATLARAPHHLIGSVPTSEAMDVEKFRRLALGVIGEIHSRRKPAIIVGGSGLYVKALTHGLTNLPKGDAKLRAQLDELTLAQLQKKLADLDPEAIGRIDFKNRRRVERAIEICLLSGKRFSKLLSGVGGSGAPGSTISVIANGVFVFRDREDLYQRINRRVEEMFERGVSEEVRAATSMSLTASQMIGLREIRELIEGKISTVQCVAAIQQATRRYAKRQLTWFRRQTSFQPLNLSLLTHQEAVKWISQKARFALAQGND